MEEYDLDGEGKIEYKDYLSLSNHFGIPSCGPSIWDGSNLSNFQKLNISPVLSDNSAILKKTSKKSEISHLGFPEMKIWVARGEIIFVKFKM